MDMEISPKRHTVNETGVRYIFKDSLKNMEMTNAVTGILFDVFQNKVDEMIWKR